ncbi:MAG: ATP-binding cassette domain-containing protein [Thermomicrobiales bacterium]|nr:ATP-binding cassette domain-containing protein [Thermomicrobiales bacterium]
MIQVEHATKRYGNTTVVDAVSLTIDHGGLTTIIGPNGAGKSTLLGMMSRLIGMDGGRISVDGLDVSTTPSRTLAQRLSILRQDNRLDARLTVRDLVAFGRYPYSRGRLTIEDRDKIDAAIDYMQLDALRERFLDELSGGQRQRAFVAMVLAQDTDYLLLDEPLNSLDMKHAAGMMRLLRRTADELGKTIVLVLHDINFASCYSDRIIAMADGRVLYHTTPAEVMTPEALEHIYDIEVDVREIEGDRIGIYYR